MEKKATKNVVTYKQVEEAKLIVRSVFGSRSDVAVGITKLGDDYAIAVRYQSKGLKHDPVSVQVGDGVDVRVEYRYTEKIVAREKEDKINGTE